jgi:hypothetical protein
MPLAVPHFMIRNLMTAAATLAGAAAVLIVATIEMSGPGLMAIWTVPLEIAMVFALNRMFRRFRRLSARCVGVVAVLGNVSSVVLCVYTRNLEGVVVVILIWLVSFPLILGAGAAWAAAATRPNAVPPRSPVVAWSLVGGLAFAPLTMILTLWPLRLAFEISRPAMDRLADLVAARHGYGGPQWAGMFYVAATDVDTDTGNVALIIDTNASGRSGFVRVGPGIAIDRNTPHLLGLIFNDHLGGRWSYQNED